MQDTNLKKKKFEINLNGNILESLEFYKDIIEFSPLGFLFISNDNKIMHCNSAAATLFGYEKEDFMNLSIFDLLSHIKIEIGNEDNFVQRVLKNQDIWNLETQIRKKDGDLNWINFNMKSIFNKEKEVIGSYIIALEIKLTQSEEKYRSIFNSITTAVVIYEGKNNGKDFIVKDLNKSAEQIEKVNKFELVGKNVLEIFPGIEDFGLLNVFKRVWNTGIPEKYPLSYYKDKRIAGWRENFVYKLSSGEIVAVYNDQTEKVKHEKILRESEKNLNQVLNFEKMMTAISSRFVGHIDFDKAINDTLKNIGISKMVSRVYLFSFDDKKKCMTNTHEWCDEGINPHMIFYNQISIDEFPDAMEYIFQGKYISVEDSADLTKGAIKLKKLLSERNVKATLAYPISINNSISGFIGFDDEITSRIWFPEDYSLLKITSQIIGNVLERKVAESNLKESEEKYRLISEDSDDLILVYNEKLILEYLNEETHSRILGYATHLFWKQTFRNLMIHPDDLIISGPTIKEGYKKGSYKIQLRYKHSDGHYLWFEVTGKTFYDKYGAKKLLVVGRDINEIKLGEQKLLESEQELIERVKELNLLFEISMTIEKKNLPLEAFFHEILKKFPNAWQYPSLICAKIIYKEKVYKSINFQDTDWTLSATINVGINKLTITVIYLEEKQFLKEEEQLISEILVRLKAILEQKEFEKILSQSEERYRNILESIKEGYFEVDLQGNFIFVNDAICEITGYNKEEIMNSNFSILCDETTREYLLNEYKDLLTKREGFKILEYQQINKNREIAFIESSLYLKNDSNENLIGFKGVVRDVSERKKSEVLRKQFNKKLEEEVELRTLELAEALEKQKLYLDQIIKGSQFKTEFLATMSHELRTPLNAIIGFTDLLLEGVYGKLNREQQEFLIDIKSSAEHQFEMIAHILDISKIESGQVSLKLEIFQLNELIENIMSTLRPLLNEKNLEFEMKGFKKRIKVRADRLKIKQIIYNLVTNAIKFTKKGVILIEFSDNKLEWEINVVDTGIGIAEEDFGLIFKDFKRVKSSYVDSTPGSGLGLALTKRIVDLHRGKINFKSTLGKGSSFSFMIPKDLESQIIDIEQFLKNL